LGVDLKWGLTSNLTLDATLNPDFGQVEVDPAVINLTEFETSFTEKRPFFLEGAQIFTNFGSIGTGSSPLDHDLFYSRRIGREPQGEADGDHVDQPIATTILGAAKLTGKTANGWSIGLMEAVTDRERARAFDRGQNSSIEIEPLTNYFVGRLVKEGRGGGSGVIATAVNRLFDGSEALASDLAQQAYTAGYDGHVFFGAKRDWVLSGVAVGSHVTGTQSAIRRLQRSSRRYYQRPDVSYVRLDPTATSLSGWTGGLHLRRQSGNIRLSGSIAATSPGFEVNDLGFQRRADETDASATVTWLKYTPDAFTRRRSLSVTKSWGWNFGRIKQSDSWSLSTSLTFPNYWYASARASFNATTFDDHLTRGGPLALRPRSLSISSDFGSDARKVVWIGSGGSYEQNEFGSWEGSGYASIRVRPSERVRLSAGPYFYRSHDIAQYVTTVRDALATDTFGNRYVFSNLEQRQFSLTTRADLSLSRDVSFQLYMEPFVGVGRYQNLQEFAAPATFSFLRYGEDIGSLTFDPEEALYTVDPDGPGPAAPFSVGNQDFNYKSLVIKAVFRWEWRPGSTLYLAWTQDRFDDRHPGDFNLSRDAGLLFRAPADDVFLVKLSYWFSR
jgi:hypothetical protein